MHLLLLPFACTNPTVATAEEPDSTEVPGNPAFFGSFYAQFQDKYCPLAVGECAGAAVLLDCLERTDTPACFDFNPATAALCLEGEGMCAEGLLAPSACDAVCSNLALQEVGSTRITPHCEQMLLCDQALGIVVEDYTPAFPDGLEDPAYGAGGTCYEGDPDACDAACESAVFSLRTAAESFVQEGSLGTIPAECL